MAAAQDVFYCGTVRNWPPALDWLQLAYRRSRDGVYFTHVMPNGDLRPHHGPRCWCRPTPHTEDGHLILHHALDGREDYEVGRRLPN